MIAWPVRVAEPLYRRLIGLLWKRKTPRPAAIIGSGHREHMLYKRLEEEGEYHVVFFIDEEPWSHRTLLGRAELRYPVELPALCEKHKIQAIFYCFDHLLESLPKVDVTLIRA